MNDYDLSLYDYNLPEDLIAKYPSDRRDHSRLLIYNRKEDKIIHTIFKDIENFLDSNDCLVINNTKVFPARILFKKKTGGQVEIFLLHFPISFEKNKSRVDALIKSSKKPVKGDKFYLGNDFILEITGSSDDGIYEILIHHESELENSLFKYGSVPIPPYLKRTQEEIDLERYQTEYAKVVGSVAAPTAGLHFTKELLASLIKKGVKLAEITLHVGLGTFKPIKSKDIRHHKLHPEWISVNQEACNIINTHKKNNGRIIAVGTTSTRTLEFLAEKNNGLLVPYQGLCDLYIYPGRKIYIVDALITNFHLPKSSLLVLVATFIEREKLLSIYQEAINLGYRFYSYGDAMFII